MVTTSDMIEAVGMLCLVVAVTVLASWAWAVGLAGLLLVAKAAELERRP